MYDSGALHAADVSIAIVEDYVSEIVDSRDPLAEQGCLQTEMCCKGT